MASEKLPVETIEENLAQEQGAVVVQMFPEGNKKQSEEKTLGKEKDQSRILELQNELIGGKNEEIESLKNGLDIFENMARTYGIKNETIVLDTGEIDGKEHSYKFPNLETPSKEQDLYLAMLGSMATSLDVDLSSRGLSVEDIMLIIKSRIAVSEKLAA